MCVCVCVQRLGGRDYLCMCVYCIFVLVYVHVCAYESERGSVMLSVTRGERVTVCVYKGMCFN